MLRGFLDELNEYGLTPDESTMTELSSSFSFSCVICGVADVEPMATLAFFLSLTAITQLGVGGKNNVSSNILQRKNVDSRDCGLQRCLIRGKNRGLS